MQAPKQPKQPKQRTSERTSDYTSNRDSDRTSERTFWQKDRLRFCVLLALLLVVNLGLILANLASGSFDTTVSELIWGLFHPHSQEDVALVLWTFRLPRLFLAAFAGGALALSGYLLQVFFHNPIAGPFTLGIASGAKMSLTLALLLANLYQISLSSTGMLVAAISGSLLVMVLILAIARRIHRSTTLVIAGLMIGYLCSAVTDFLINFSSDQLIANMGLWAQGTFSGASWDDLKICIPFISLLFAASFLLAKPLLAYEMGEVYAQSAGVNLKMFRVTLIFITSSLAAIVTAYAGPISFVGLAVPHLVHTGLRNEQPHYVIPTCFLTGSAFCLLCDWIARTAFAPVELGLSSLTALFGAPIVLRLLFKRQKKNR